MITSPQNEKLKTVRKLATRRERERSGLFVAEGEDLIEAAIAAGATAEFVLATPECRIVPLIRAQSCVLVEAGLLDGVSSLGSGTRVIGVYEQEWSEPHGNLSLYLHGVGDPGNVGTAIRSAHAFADGPVILGPDCADPYSPKAVRASTGSIFAKPPGRAGYSDLTTTLLALDARAEAVLADTDPAPPVTVCLGAEREGLPKVLLDSADHVARIPVREDGPESLNVAMAATIALYDLANRMASSP